MPSPFRLISGSKISFFAFQDIITSVTGILILVTLILTLYVDRPAETPANPDQSSHSQEARLAEVLEQADQVRAQIKSLQQNLAVAIAAPDTDRLKTDIVTISNQIHIESARMDSLELELQQRITAEHEREQILGLVDLRQQNEKMQTEAHELQLTNQAAQLKLQSLLSQSNQMQARLSELRDNPHQLWLTTEFTNASKTPILIVMSRTNITCERFNKPGEKTEFAASEGNFRFIELLNRLNPAADYLVFFVRPSGIGLFQQFRDTAKIAGFDVGYDAVEEDKQILFSAPSYP